MESFQRNTTHSQNAHLFPLWVSVEETSYPKNVIFNHSFEPEERKQSTYKQNPRMLHKSLEVRKSHSSLPSFLHENTANPTYTCFRIFSFMWLSAQEKKQCSKHCCVSANKVKFKSLNHFLSKRISVTTTLSLSDPGFHKIINRARKLFH